MAAIASPSCFASIRVEAPTLTLQPPFDKSNDERSWRSVIGASTASALWTGQKLAWFPRVASRTTIWSQQQSRETASGRRGVIRVISETRGCRTARRTPLRAVRALAMASVRTDGKEGTSGDELNDLSKPSLGRGRWHVAHAGSSTGDVSTSDVGRETPLSATYLEDFALVAHRLADEAGKVILNFFRSPILIEDKLDMSPVTIADRMAEEVMRKIIALECPSHGIFGEEHGLTLGSGDGEFVWVLDPIDGTKSFITGKPLFGTLISLLHNGVPVLGVIDQPVLKERWVGLQGQKTTLNGKVVTARKCSQLSEAYMYSTTPHMFSGDSEKAFLRIRDKVRMPLYGCDCYAYGLLATGFVDLVVEADLKPYDYMALVPVIKGAGGTITDWRGGDLSWRFTTHTPNVSEAPGEVVAAGDPIVHKQALEALGWIHDRQGPSSAAVQGLSLSPVIKDDAH